MPSRVGHRALGWTTGPVSSHFTNVRDTSLSAAELQADERANLAAVPLTALDKRMSEIQKLKVRARRGWRWWWWCWWWWWWWCWC